MCMKTDCEKCNKPTWKGCGKHIEQALKDVPEDERCKCPRNLPGSTVAAVKTTEEIKNAVEIKTEETKNAAEVKTEESKNVAKVQTEEAKAEETKHATAEIKTEETKAETTADNKVKVEEKKEKED